MAETVNSDLIIYDDQAQTAYLERIQDVLEIFNAQSAGAFVMRQEIIEGNLSKRSFYKVGGAIAHRDVNSTSSVTPSNIDAGEMIGVKVPWKYGPFAATEESFKRRARSPEEFSQVVGQDMADAVMEGWVEYGVAGVEAAIRSNAASMVVPASWATDGKKALTKGLRTFGDRFSRIAIWVMDSQMYFDVVDNAIDEKLFGEIGVVVYGGQPGTMGRPVLVTDKAPSGVILGLQPGAISVLESQAPGFRSYPIDDKENIARGFRAEGTFNLDTLGYSWNAQTGGINPNLAAVGNAANWAKHATSDKVTAGFIIDFNGGGSGSASASASA